MRRARMLLAGAVLATALSGCAGVPGFPAPRPDATPVAEIACTEAFPGAGSTVASGAVPDGFEPVALYRCDPYAADEDDAGTWSGARLERFDGDLGPLLAALAEPDGAQWLGACTAIGFAGPELWLADAQGHYIRVAYPADGCGQPTPGAVAAVNAAIERLRLTEETFTPAMLLESRAAEAAGCATQAGVMVLADLSDVAGMGASPAPSREEVATIPWEPAPLPSAGEVDGLLVCRYEAGAEGQGTFAAAGRLGVDDARAAVSAAASPAPDAPACRSSATRLAVAHPLIAGEPASAPFTVELDGCRRLIDPGLRASVAPPELLALLASV
ncbi:hypothetical protein [Microbacterium lushaniae]|uniref:Septum formation-related domain-containing protein n=1 Tax=Microbacterium lushaniae TaxID=2614639 RepID=A0A5J6L5W8_9MICO|nr:hypothetical protein [Microbacterium lushaniae]QEW04049.1 hypothetical protein F6J85_13745 [Microbacterium lushaniae]